MLGGLHDQVPDVLRVELGTESEWSGLIFMDSLFYNLDKYWKKNGMGKGVGESGQQVHMYQLGHNPFLGGKPSD